jgi:hypothetical protein
MPDQTADTPVFLIKKLGGLVLLILGLLVTAFGYFYASSPLTFIGVILLAAGVILLALKVIRRNPT